MKPLILRPGFGDNSPTATLFYGQDVRDSLRLLPEASVHTVCTSPPYFGLRDYGIGDEQIGLEKTPEKYVENLVAVFREVKRVLRSDGTLWLNLGDSYATSNPVGRRDTNDGDLREGRSTPAGSYTVNVRQKGFLGSKQLMGMPWRVAFALQADGWYLRSDIIWHKPNPMPESVKDRPTKAHEYLFLLTQSPHYYYDARAIMEPAAYGAAHAKKATSWGTNRKHPNKANVADYSFVGDNKTTHRGEDGSYLRNKRSVWTVATRPFSGAHFAVWPPGLVRPMILAGTSEEGCCSGCGAPRKRERTSLEVAEKPEVSTGGYPDRRDGGVRTAAPKGSGGGNLLATKTQSGKWKPTCSCENKECTRAVVLDPFSGSSTTGMVALQEGRNYIGIDLNAEYLDLARARIEGRRAPKQSNPSGEGVSDVFDLFGG